MKFEDLFRRLDLFDISAGLCLLFMGMSMLILAVTAFFVVVIRGCGQ